MTFCEHEQRSERRLERFALLAGLVAGLALAAIPAPSEARIIKSLTPQPFFFSPARGDSLTLRYEIEDTAAVFLFVLEKNSATVVDTLLAGVERLSEIQYSAVWRGAYFDGTPAPEDTFIALIRAEGAAETDSLFSQRFFIDATTPQVFITLVDPGLVAPGSSDPAASPDVEVTYTVSDPPPGDSVEVDVVVYGPEGDLVQALPEKLVAAIGSAKSVWNGESATDDGLHKIELTVRDRSSNSASARGYVDVDIAGPAVDFTNLPDDTTTRVVPDSLFGWAWDRSGVRDTVWVEYPGSTVFVPAPSNYIRADTVFFAVGLKDSIAAEGKYSYRVKAIDKPGQVTFKEFEITWDATAPAAPVLAEPPAVWHSPDLLLDGTVGGGLADVMRIYRNDALADTIFPNIEGQWPYLLALERGTNRIWAVLVDGAGNVSEPSNTIEVKFDPSAGLYIPQPFHPGDAFQFNVSGVEFGVKVRVYDMSGNLVRVLTESWAGEFVSIPWDGLNGDGVKVHKGPLVAVAYVDSSTGKREPIRKIFLFEP